MDPARALEIRKPLDDLEEAVVARDLASPGELSPELVSALRYVISFARLTEIRTSDGLDVEVAGALAPHRWRVMEALRPHLSGGDQTLWSAVRVLPALVAATREQRRQLLERGEVDRDALEAEVCQRQLVVVCGGGGGSGYGYAGAYALLHRHGLQPELLAGTSMGALMGLFRARKRGFDGRTLMAASRRLSWNTVFRVYDADSIYGLPASLRLYLRGAIGHLFQDQSGRTLTFRDLGLPLLVVATGLTLGGLKHDLDYYEHFLDDAIGPGQIFKPSAIVRLGKLAGIAREFMSEPEALREIVFGGDDDTLDADVLDAAGFSAAVTGLIHYDIYRDDAHMKHLLDHLYAVYGITRLTEGGLVNNVPVRPAFAHVMKGAIGRRNPYIVALDCFSPQRRNLLFMPLQQLVRINVARNIPYANLYMALQRRLSPLNLVPKPEHLVSAMRWTMDELEPRMPTLRRFLAPLPVLRDVAE